MAMFRRQRWKEQRWNRDGNPMPKRTILDVGMKPTVLLAEDGLIIAKDAEDESRLKIFQGEHVWEIKKQGHNVVEAHATDVMIVVFYVNVTEYESDDLYGTMGVWCRNRRMLIAEKHIGVPYAFKCGGSTILIQDEGHPAELQNQTSPLRF